MSEQSRARYPDEQGHVERDGVRLFYELYGEGERTVLLLPTWSVIHSRHWKAQIPYLARHHRVLVFDGRGNGRSDRPRGHESYFAHQFAADTLAVMDATGTDSAFMVALSAGAMWGTLLAADHPERVDGIAYIGPAVPLVPGHSLRTQHSFEDELDTDEGWAKVNRHYWMRDYPGFLEFFFGQMFTEPHSTKQIEDCIGWGLEVDPETMVDITRGLAPPTDFHEACARVRCPVMVIHGSEDRVQPPARGEDLARATGGSFVKIEGGGHIPNVRDPIRVNLAIRDFIGRLGRPA